MLRFGFFALILPLSSFAGTRKEKEDCPKGKQHYRTAIRHIESGGIGYEDGYTTLEMFLASDPSQWKITPFLDARGHVFNNGKLAVNVGIGLRTLLKNRAYGLNTYYDYRNTGRFSSNQIGAGLETLGKLFDFRMNGYFPVGGKITDPYNTTFWGFSGNYMIVSQKYQSAMKGADAEFGFHFGKSKSFDFYAAAGPYYFIGEKAPCTWGGKGRVAGRYKELLALEVSDSYDRTFHNKFQGQISLTFAFGPKSKNKKQKRTCKDANTLNDRMLQPVSRQEIIVIDNITQNTPAIDPATGHPYFFVFVDNTGSSNGTYESPYHSLIQAQSNSSPNNIIYVFPGDGSTTGMDSGIYLQANQKFWGSGVSHLLQTSAGEISIPAQTSSLPTITNTNVDTEGNAITLATHNSISGFIITSALNDAIYGADPQSLEVSSCIIQATNTYVIEASFSDKASVSLTNNQFLNNVNGVSLNFNGTSNLVCLDNTFTGQTSVSNVPIEISTSSNVLDIQIENNVFNDNVTGSIRLSLDNAVDTHINLLNNVMTNNGTGSQSSLGSSFVILSNGTTDNCSIVLRDNVLSGNTSNFLYMHTSGAVTNLDITASANTLSNNGGSAFVLATPVDTLTLLAQSNRINGCADNGIAVISSTATSTGNITIKDNIITDIANTSNGIALNQDFSTLHLTILNNEIRRCEGSGIISYAPTGISSLILNISDNTITGCENLSSNAAAGLDIEQYIAFEGSVTNNVFSDNTGTAVTIGSTLETPTACLTLTGNNSSTGYLLTNPESGIFRLTPCNVDSVNTGMINTSGTIDLVQSCSSLTPCPP